MCYVRSFETCRVFPDFTCQEPWGRIVRMRQIHHQSWYLIPLVLRYIHSGVNGWQFADSESSAFQKLALLCSTFTYQYCGMPYSHHSHSGQFCNHATNTLEEVVTKAIERKMEMFALTEHMPREEGDLYPEEVTWIDPSNFTCLYLCLDHWLTDAS